MSGTPECGRRLSAPIPEGRKDQRSSLRRVHEKNRPDASVFLSFAAHGSLIACPARPARCFEGYTHPTRGDHPEGRGWGHLLGHPVHAGKGPAPNRPSGNASAGRPRERSLPACFGKNRLCRFWTQQPLSCQ